MLTEEQQLRRNYWKDVHSKRVAKNPNYFKDRAAKRYARNKQGQIKSSWKYIHRNVKGLPAFEDKPETCEVCGSTGRICLDHCHEKNEFRGWLCTGCNTALGHAKDNPERLEALATYLRRKKEPASQ